MPLPKISNPVHNITIPSNKKKVPIRQMTIKDEKILLVAKESDEDKDRQDAIVQVINNCIMEDGFDVNGLTMFDVEYLFLKIRALSVTNKIDLTITEPTDDEPVTHEFKVDLNDVEIKYPEEAPEKQIQLDDIMIELKYPTMEMYLSKEFQDAEKESDVMSIIIKHSIASVFQGDRAFQFTLDEAAEFVDQLPASAFEKISKFFEKQPTLYHSLEYKDVNGKKQKQELTTLSDFFMF